MTAFTPPATTWCPDCARERVSCRHLDADALRADGGDDLFCDGCGTAHGVRLVRVRDPDGIITTCASCEDDLNSTIVEEIDPDRIAADGGRRTLVSDYRTDGDEPSTTFEDAEACEECGKANAGVRAADGRALCGTCHKQGTGELVTDGGLVDDIEVDDAETPAIDRARDAHPKWLELVSAASRRDKGRVERLADELRGDLTFIERTIDDLATDGGDADGE